MHGIRIEFVNERGHKKTATYLPEVAKEQSMLLLSYLPHSTYSSVADSNAYFSFSPCKSCIFIDRRFSFLRMLICRPSLTNPLMFPNEEAEFFTFLGIDLSFTSYLHILLLRLSGYFRFHHSITINLECWSLFTNLAPYFAYTLNAFAFLKCSNQLDFMSSCLTRTSPADRFFQL